MKYLLLIPVAILSVALQIPAANAQQAGQTANTAVNVPASLTKKIDASKVKVGKEVTAVITEDTKLPDGTALPKGTKLVGTVTSVPGKDGASRLGFDFDRAVLHTGQTVLVHTTPSSTSEAAASTVASSDASGSLDSGTKMTLDVSSRR
jgi:hypothetical protein